MGTLTESRTTARDRIMGELDKLPPFSPVLTKLLATLADDDVSFGELAAIIETDAVLAGNLLRVVNSPLYGRAATINSVRHAVAIVGSVKIRNLVLGMSVSRRWAGARVPGIWNPRQFNEHSLAVAVLSDLVVLEAPVPYPEGAFTAGLLHDVGKLLIAVAMPAQFEQVFDMRMGGARPLADCELETIGVTHAEISGAILERWKLPKPIQEAAAYHHAPDRASGGELHLAHVIQAADHYINSHGLGAPPHALDPAEAFENCYRKLGLSDCILKVAETFQAEFEAVRSFF
jgi:HD-like signal output (HDOD) protein